MKKPKKRRSTKRRWSLQSLPGSLDRQHGIDLPVPFPERELERINRAGFGYEELARWMTRYIEENPSDERAETYRAIAARFLKLQDAVNILAAQRPDEAIPLLEELAEAYPDDAVVKLNLADCHNAMGNPEKALELVDVIHEVFAESTRYVILRSRVLVMAGRRTEARDHLLAIYRRAPQNLALQQELIRMGELIPVRLNARNLAQNAYLDRKEYRKKILERMGQLHGAKDLEGTLRTLRSLVESNILELAVEVADRSVSVFPGASELHLLLGRAQAALRQYEVAEGSLQRARELADETEDAQTAVTLALFLRGRERQGEAHAVLQSVLNKDRNCLPALEAYLLSFPSLAEQLDEVQKYRAAHPDSWAAKKLEGDLLFRQGQLQTAVSLHREAFESAGHDDALTMLLHDYDRLDQTEEAVRVIRATEDLNERGAAVRWNAANLYLKGGRAQPAIDILQRLVSDPVIANETRFSAARLLNRVYSTSQGRR